MNLRGVGQLIGIHAFGIGTCAVVGSLLGPGDDVSWKYAFGSGFCSFWNISSCIEIESLKYTILIIYLFFFENYIHSDLHTFLICSGYVEAE